MAQSKVMYEELRIDTRDPQTSHFYVLCRVIEPKVNDQLDAKAESLWHHKAFPVCRPVLDVVKDWQLGLIVPWNWEIVGGPP